MKNIIGVGLVLSLCIVANITYASEAKGSPWKPKIIDVDISKNITPRKTIGGSSKREIDRVKNIPLNMPRNPCQAAYLQYQQKEAQMNACYDRDRASEMVQTDSIVLKELDLSLGKIKDAECRNFIVSKKAEYEQKKNEAEQKRKSVSHYCDISLFAINDPLNEKGLCEACNNKWPGSENSLSFMDQMLCEFRSTDNIISESPNGMATAYINGKSFQLSILALNSVLALAKTSPRPSCNEATTNLQRLQTQYLNKKKVCDVATNYKAKKGAAQAFFQFTFDTLQVPECQINFTKLGNSYYPYDNLTLPPVAESVFSNMSEDGAEHACIFEGERLPSLEALTKKAHEDVCASCRPRDSACVDEGFLK